MAEKIDTARHRRIGEFFSGLEYIFRKGLQPRRFLLLIVTFLLAGLLALVLGNYAPRVYRDWRQKRLLDRASSLLQEQKFNEAAHMAREAVNVRPDSLKGYYVLAEATEKQNLEETVSWRAQIARLLPNDPDSQLNLASAALRFGEIDLARQALDRVSPKDRDRAAFLLCLNFYRKLDQKKFRPLLERVKPFAARNSTDLTSLMNWMNENGLAGDAAKWVDKLPPQKLTSPPVSVAVADAYANVKNWSHLKRWTRSGSWDDAEYLRLAYQAIATRRTEQNSEDEFRTLWLSAEQTTEERPERELNLARLASRSNLETESEQLWLRVANNHPRRRQALDTLRLFYLINYNLEILYGILQRLHESSPNEAPITADLARLGLNLEQDIERSHQLAKEAYDRAPDEPNCAVTYAFSLYRLGRSAEALAIIQRLPPDQLHDPHAAVYVALLLLDANQIDAAKDYIAADDAARIYGEEKKLLDEARNKLATALATPSPSVSPSPGEPSPAPALTSTPPSL